MAAPSINQLIEIISFKFFIFATLLCHAHAAGPSWNKPEVTVKQGDSVSLVCSWGQVADSVPDVHRVQITRPGTSLPSVVADNSHVKDAYSKLKRLKVVLSAVNRTTTLIYTGIRGEDSGTYSCYSFSTSHLKAVMKVTVQVPVESVSLYKLSANNAVRGRPLHEDDSIVLVEKSGSVGQLSGSSDPKSGSQGQKSGSAGQKSGSVGQVSGSAGQKSGSELSSEGVECVVSVDGSLTPPSVSIMLGDFENVTDKFRREIAREVKHNVTPEDVGTYKVVVTLSHNGSADRRWNGKRLMCVAESEGFRKIKSSVDISVLYAPVISCGKTVQTGDVGRDVTWSCDVDSNPGAQIKWFTGQNVSNVSSLNVTRDVRTSAKSVKSDQSRVELSIAVVNSSHYTSYHLSATNRIGSSNVTLTLYRPGSPLAAQANTSNGGTPCSCGLSQIFILFLFTLYLQYREPVRS